MVKSLLVLVAFLLDHIAYTKSKAYTTILAKSLLVSCQLSLLPRDDLCGDESREGGGVGGGGEW